MSALAPIAASFRLGRSTVFTRGRLLASAALIAIVVLQFVALAGEGPLERDLPITLLFAIVVSILIPVFVVSTSSNVFGAAVSDGTLVYPWLRPAPRWQLALGHVGAGLALNLPVALLAGGGAGLVLAQGSRLPGDQGRAVLLVMLAAGLAALAYSPLVTALGVRFKRASVFAFVYIFLWEQVFARNSTGLARLSIQTYVRSAYFGVSGDEPLAELGRYVSPGIAWLVLGLIVALGVALTTFFLKRADVA